MNRTPELHSPQRDWRKIAFLAGACLLLIVAGGFAYSIWIATDDPEGDGLVFVIPAGASETLEVPTIDTAIAIPTEIVFQPGEQAEVTIVNEDSVANRAGPWVVGPGQKYSIRLDKPGEYQFDCAVNSAESVTITVKQP